MISNNYNISNLKLIIIFLNFLILILLQFQIYIKCYFDFFKGLGAKLLLFIGEEMVSGTSNTLVVIFKFKILGFLLGDSFRLSCLSTLYMVTSSRDSEFTLRIPVKFKLSLGTT